MVVAANSLGATIKHRTSAHVFLTDSPHGQEVKEKAKEKWEAEGHMNKKGLFNLEVQIARQELEKACPEVKAEVEKLRKEDFEKRKRERDEKEAEAQEAKNSGGFTLGQVIE